MLQPVAPAVRQQPDALGEPSGEALDVTNFADIVAATLEALSVSFASLFPTLLRCGLLETFAQP